MGRGVCWQPVLWR